MRKKPILRLAAVSSLIILSGCSVDISVTLPESDRPEAEPDSSVYTSAPGNAAADTPDEQTAVPGEEPDENSAGTSAEQEEPEVGTVVTSGDITEVYKKYVLTDEDNEFISKCVFVGDSICSGLEGYDIIPADNVLAKGNVGARNIFEFTFRLNGSEMSLLSALVDLRPEYVVFSMGMNDVNITSPQTFCENYGELLSQVQSFLPDTQLIVCSVTPVTYTSRFTSNENIDSFNAALKEYLDSTEKWIYADITHELKNPLNALKSQYDGDNKGVHLTSDAYSAILYQICERMVSGLVYENGEMIPLVTLPEDDADTTSAPSEGTDDGAGSEEDDVVLLNE